MTVLLVALLVLIYSFQSLFCKLFSEHYDLGDAAGVIGSIDQIDSVIVNGEPLEGYIDMGLIDTMGDMMIETAGAAAYAVVFALDKGRHPAFIHAAMASLPGKKSVHAQVE